jgi:L-ascorbate metabolism protein UlaG (beta-lactamase superfamily)
VQAFFKTRVEAAIEEIEKADVAEGARIWKIYNHGFVVRTRSVTFAFDVVQARRVGVPGFVIPDDLAARLVAQCDALFRSHMHSDHVEPELAALFAAAGKPVVGPPGIPGASASGEKLVRPERDATKSTVLKLGDAEVEVEVVCFPGHQADMPNNIYAVTTREGITVMHTGDQSSRDDLAWIDGVGKAHQIDVLLPNCWTNDLPRMVKGVRPKLLITGHENELAHEVRKREPFWKTYQLKEKVDAPLIPIAWGESYHYKR